VTAIPRSLPLAFALAAVTASGCIIETGGNQGDVNLYWSFWHSELLGDFGGLSATATEVCTRAGVEEIEITLTDPAGDVRETVSGSCITSKDVPGARFVDLDAGTWDYYVAGLRGGVPVFDDWGSFTIYEGEEWTEDARMDAIYFDLQIDYVAESCPAGGRIDFDLYATGDLGNPVFSTNHGPNPPVTLSCSTLPKALVIPSVPGGTYAFGEWIQYDAGGFEVGWSDCSPTWTQSDFANSTVAVDLVGTPTGGYCP
jgi:hypothetical protein